MIEMFVIVSGYTFSFPFLSVDCGLCLEDMYFVQPLYKHLININRPTMAICGLQICAYSYMYDLQVLYFIFVDATKIANLSVSIVIMI